MDELDQFISYAYERICWQYLRKLNKNDLLPFHFTKIGHWWDKTDEIDILATDNRGTRYLVGECKYKKSKVGMKELLRLKEKADKFSEHSILYFFSKSGFSQELLDYAATENITLVDLQQISSVPGST